VFWVRGLWVGDAEASDAFSRSIYVYVILKTDRRDLIKLSEKKRKAFVLFDIHKTLGK